MKRTKRNVVRWITNGGGTNDPPSIGPTYGVIFNAGTVGAAGRAYFGLVGTALQLQAGQKTQWDDPLIERLKVLTVRGKVLLDNNNLTQPILWAMGIFVSQASTFSASGITYDPFNASDGGAPWAWLEYGELSPGDKTTTFPNGWKQAVPVHMRSKRVLRPDQLLILTISWTGVEAGRAFNVLPFLRTLITKVA